MVLVLAVDPVVQGHGPQGHVRAKLALVPPATVGWERQRPEKVQLPV